ncbi:hypothetical protein WMY93_032752 [Mugilogobius chulae]|uniref:Uncharacterized protein n=1 Tax=Mugilogobius chulae TaxID=88201 RepID=A0AAW0MJY8_9GOBI
MRQGERREGDKMSREEGDIGERREGEKERGGKETRREGERRQEENKTKERGERESIQGTQEERRDKETEETKRGEKERKESERGGKERGERRRKRGERRQGERRVRNRREDKRQGERREEDRGEKERGEKERGDKERGEREERGDREREREERERRDKERGGRREKKERGDRREGEAERREGERTRRGEQKRRRERRREKRREKEERRGERERGEKERRRRRGETEKEKERERERRRGRREGERREEKRKETKREERRREEQEREKGERREGDEETRREERGERREGEKEGGDKERGEKERGERREGKRREGDKERGEKERRREDTRREERRIENGVWTGFNQLQNHHGNGKQQKRKILRVRKLKPQKRKVRLTSEDDVAEKRRSNEMLQKAINSYREVSELPEVTPDLLKAALKRRAERQQFLGRTRGSVATLEKLVQMFPEDYSLKNDLGVSHLLLGDNRAAKQVYEQVLAVAPDDGFAKVHYGFILKSENQIAESIPYLREGLESNEPGTDDGRFYFHLGDALQRVGLREEAHSCYTRGHQRGTSQSGYTELVKTLERNWKLIRDEALAVMDQESGLSCPKRKPERDREWGQYTLWQQGRKSSVACQKSAKDVFSDGEVSRGHRL